MKKDLADSILELRNEVERRLMRNKYYVAIKKLDDLLEAIRPLEAEVIDEGMPQRAALTSQPALESPAPVEPASEEIFAAPPQHPDGGETFQRQDAYHAQTNEPEAPHQAAPAAPDQPSGPPNMPESLGNVYPAAPQPQPTTPQHVQPVEEVFQPSSPQHGYEQNAGAPDSGQQQQRADALFATRHSAAE